MCINFKFGINLDYLSKDKSIISDETEEILISVIENNQLFVSFEELGINEEDIYNPEFFSDLNNDDKIVLNADFTNLKLTNLYRYVSDKYGSSNYSDNSRKFCIELAKRSNISMLTYESVVKLNGSNPGQGPLGTDNYSIFDWRGGKNCVHKWIKYYYDTETKNLVKAPINQQPTQKTNSKGGVPKYPNSKK
jgi:hypothetical protein